MSKGSLRHDPTIGLILYVESKVRVVVVSKQPRTSVLSGTVDKHLSFAKHLRLYSILTVFCSGTVEQTPRSIFTSLVQHPGLWKLTIYSYSEFIADILLQLPAILKLSLVSETFDKKC